MSELDEQQDKRNELAWKIFLWAMAILLGVLFHQYRQLSTEVRNHDTRLTTIMASRCTAADCANIRATISSIQAQVSALPTKIPPDWFLNKVNTIERKLELLQSTQWQNADKRARQALGQTKK